MLPQSAFTYTPGLSSRQVDVNNIFLPGTSSLDWVLRISRELAIQGDSAGNVPPTATVPLYGGTAYHASPAARVRALLPTIPEDFSKVAPLAGSQVFFMSFMQAPILWRTLSDAFGGVFDNEVMRIERSAAFWSAVQRKGEDGIYDPTSEADRAIRSFLLPEARPAEPENSGPKVREKEVLKSCGLLSSWLCGLLSSSCRVCRSCRGVFA